MSHLRHCRYEKHESIRPEAKGSTLQDLDDIPNHDVRNGSATEEYLQEVQQSCYLYA